MNTRGSSRLSSHDTDLEPTPGDIVEIPLLLPGWQVAALEMVAHDRGLTAGEMVRRLLRNFISGMANGGHEKPTNNRQNVEMVSANFAALLEGHSIG